MHGHSGTQSKASARAEKASRLRPARKQENVKASDGTVYAIQPNGAYRVCDRHGKPSRRLSSQEKRAHKRGRVKRLKAQQET